MSVLHQVYASPIRVAAIISYLLEQKDHSLERNKLELIISPNNLRSEDGSKGDMVKGVIQECITMGLVEQSLTNGKHIVSLSRSALESYGDPPSDKQRIRELITQIVISGRKNNSNEDICLFLAWYLAQDIYTMKGDWDSMNTKLIETFGPDRMGFTQKTRWNQFGFWAIYIGMAWSCGDDMFPDPTNYICRILPKLAVKYPRSIKLATFLNELANSCPVFKGGVYYDKISKYLTDSADKTVSPAISNALIRLEQAGRIVLNDTSADATELMLLRVSTREEQRCDQIEFRKE